MVRYLTLVLAITATAAFAHVGVKDPQVLVRMHVMKDAGSALKTLEDMSKGEIAFDAAAMAVSRTSILEMAAVTPQVFAAPADDPKSEAKRVIWERFADFEAKAADMKRAADAFDPQTLVELQASFGALKAACVACHLEYRELN